MYLNILPSRDAFIFSKTPLDCFFTYVSALEQASKLEKGVQDILEELYLKLKADNLVEDDVLRNVDKNAEEILKALGIEIFKIDEKSLNDINREINFLFLLNTGEKIKPFSNLNEFKKAFDKLENQLILIHKREKKNDK